jgi:hypothetical protein
MHPSRVLNCHYMPELLTLATALAITLTISQPELSL